MAKHEHTGKTVTCVLCDKPVSKRQSLAFLEGRACRDHEEVIKTLEDAKESQRMDIVMQDVDDRLRALSLASGVRVYHRIHGTPVEILLGQVQREYGSDMRKEVELEIHKMGGTVLSREEMMASILTFVNLKAKKNKLEEKPA